MIRGFGVSRVVVQDIAGAPRAAVDEGDGGIINACRYSVRQVSLFWVQGSVYRLVLVELFVVVPRLLIYLVGSGLWWFR